MYHEILHRLLESVDHGKDRMMDIPVCSNLSYVKGHMSNSRAVTVNQLEDGAGPDYSSFGPDYETIDSRSGHGRSQRKNQVPTGRLSEQYEYSEAYLATLNENAPEGLGSANYEVPLKLRQNVGTANEDYSHLKH